MKKTLLSLVLLAFVGNVSAQDASTVVGDKTPAAWAFDKMDKGPLSPYFFREAGTLGANFEWKWCLGEDGKDGHKGFRWADQSQTGGYAVALYGSPEGNNIGFGQMSENSKADLEAFYNTWQVTDAGKMGNIIIYKGHNSQYTDKRVMRNDSVMEGGPNMYFVSNADLEVETDAASPVYYRLTWRVRTILPDGENDPNSQTISACCGTSWWDGLPLAGSGRTSGYGSLQGDDNGHHCYKAENEYWTEYVMEIELKQMKVTTGNEVYDIAPLLFKVGIGKDVANDAIIMFDDLKLEKVNAVTVKGEIEKQTSSKTFYYGYVKNEYGEGNDDASNYVLPNYVDGIHATKIKATELIVLRGDNGLTVFDADGPVSLYNAAGQLVGTETPSNCQAEFNVSQRGVYFVKAKNGVRKVVF